MRLVESEIETPDEGPHPYPPRPERRRVSVSLGLTVSVVISTVVAVYAVFPARRDTLLVAALNAHTESPAFDLDTPSREEIRGWNLAVLGSRPPELPGLAGANILGAQRLSVINRPAAVIRYDLGDYPLTLLIQRARDAPPRVHRRTQDEWLCVSWRKTRWTFVAVGPADRADEWRARVGAP